MMESARTAVTSLLMHTVQLQQSAALTDDFVTLIPQHFWSCLKENYTNEYNSLFAGVCLLSQYIL